MNLHHGYPVNRKAYSSGRGVALPRAPWRGPWSSLGGEASSLYLFAFQVLQYCLSAFLLQCLFLVVGYTQKFRDGEAVNNKGVY